MRRIKFNNVSRWIVPGGASVVLAIVFASVTAAIAPAGVASARSGGGELSGAQLYAINCNRCHAERYPTERPSGQWKTILTHMRVRANLPADQARAVLKYLQENSGN